MVYEDGDLFTIDPTNSDLFTKPQLDREQLCRFDSACQLRLRVAARSDTEIR